MADMGIEMLSEERIDEVWEHIEPLLEKSCASNEIGAAEISATDIYLLAKTDMCVIFIGTEDDIPKCVIAVQFNFTNGRKGADLIAMAGSRLIKFRNAFWEVIIAWLKANECKFLDAYATERLAKHYKTKFGFDQSCAYVRITL